MASGIPDDYEERFGISNSVFYPDFSVLSPFQRFIPILAFYPHFSVLSSFQRFILISAFYPHFSVLSPFQRFIPISAFYPHFSVLSPFQFPFSVCVSGIQFQRFIPTLTQSVHCALFHENVSTHIFGHFTVFAYNDSTNKQDRA